MLRKIHHMHISTSYILQWKVTPMSTYIQVYIYKYFRRMLSVETLLLCTIAKTVWRQTLKRPQDTAEFFFLLPGNNILLPTEHVLFIFGLETWYRKGLTLNIMKRFFLTASLGMCRIFLVTNEFGTAKRRAYSWRPGSNWNTKAWNRFCARCRDVCWTMALHNLTFHFMLYWLNLSLIFFPSLWPLQDLTPLLPRVGSQLALVQWLL